MFVTDKGPTNRICRQEHEWRKGEGLPFMGDASTRKDEGATACHRPGSPPTSPASEAYRKVEEALRELRETTPIVAQRKLLDQARAALPSLTPAAAAALNEEEKTEAVAHIAGRLDHKNWLMLPVEAQTFAEQALSALLERYSLTRKP